MATNIEGCLNPSFSNLHLYGRLLRRQGKPWNKKEITAKCCEILQSNSYVLRVSCNYPSVVKPYVTKPTHLRVLRCGKLLTAVGHKICTPTPETMEELKDWECVKQGIALWLNNMPKAAEESFKDRPPSVHIDAGHTFICFMNAVISWETEKMNEAQMRLRGLEKQCAGDVGWLKSVRSKLFGPNETRKSLTETLEEQIILADSQLCLAILVSLSQDISGFVKGGWLLRKAFKVYQHTYQQIYQLYTGTLQTAEDVVDGPQAPLNNRHIMESALAASLDVGTPSSSDWTVPNSSLQTPDDEWSSTHREALRKSQTTNFDSVNAVNQRQPDFEESGRADPSTVGTASGISGSLKKSCTGELSGPSHPTRAGSSVESLETIDSNAVRCTLPRNRMMLDLKSERMRNLNGLNSFTAKALGMSATQESNERHIEPHDIQRLMGAVSFGYGIFQLSISLLPPNLLKLISFLGFEGNRSVGIACLRFSRQSADMRAPLATLGLLWYYTIVTPFFALDGTDLSSEINSAQELINEASDQFAKSSLFLFFRGRVERLKSNIQEAIRAYEFAYRSSAQREIKLLCLHEIGWCRLIQLDYGTAMKSFNELKVSSQFSKSFYSYLTAICEGAFGNFSNLARWRTDILELINRSSQKDSQIEKYIFRRCLKLPRAESGDPPKYNSSLYWKYLVFEMLFLWNALGTCNVEQLESMVADCSQPMDAFSEPMLGISRLILGACLSCLARYEEAIEAFRECISLREAASDYQQQDVHISASAYYELAVLLLRQQKHEKDRTEARKLLVYAQNTFKNYDFDNRISVRIHSVLKRLE